MRFLVDECTGPAVAKWLQSSGHVVLSVYDEARGLDDESIIAKANRAPPPKICSVCRSANF